MKINQTTYVLLTTYLLIAFIIIFTYMKNNDITIINNSKWRQKNTKLINDVLKTYQTQIEEDIKEKTFINTAGYKHFSFDDAHIKISETGGIFIFSHSRKNELIYLYPEKENNQYVWHCVGSPSYRVPEFCRN